jgi:hypothetical protein
MWRFEPFFSPASDRVLKNLQNHFIFEFEYANMAMFNSPLPPLKPPKSFHFQISQFSFPLFGEIEISPVGQKGWSGWSSPVAPKKKGIGR